MRDAHAKPPDSLRVLFKSLRILSAVEIETNPEVIDPYEQAPSKMRPLQGSHAPGQSEQERLFREFTRYSHTNDAVENGAASLPSGSPFEVTSLPGTLASP